MLQYIFPNILQIFVCCQVKQDDAEEECHGISTTRTQENVKGSFMVDVVGTKIIFKPEKNAGNNANAKVILFYNTSIRLQA